MKRDDIQSLRGLSILCVVFYHYTPNWIPQEKLGVDIFFVISGFFICRMLSRPSKENFLNSSLQFYWRRLMRILPLAYSVLIFSFVIMYLHFKTFVQVNQAFGLKALLFGANIRVNVEDEYEKQLTGATILLTHFWSLSTEIQFYLFAPLISLVTRNSSFKRKVHFTLLLCVASFAHYFTSSLSIAFNSPIARLWQFLVGYIAFYSSQKNQEKSEKTCKTDAPLLTISWLSLFTIVVCVFLDVHGQLEETVLRLLVTASSGWIMFAEGTNASLLNVRPLVFIGDISYSLYLVHWPVLCFIKEKTRAVPFMITNGVVVMIVISLVLSIILYYSIEKPLLSCSSKSNFMLIGFLFVFCTILISRDFSPKPALTGNSFFDDAIEGNQLNIDHVRLHMRTQLAIPITIDAVNSGFIRQFPDGNGNCSFLIIGNSFAMNHAETIYKNIKELESRVIVQWEPRCESLATTTLYDHCVENPPEFNKIVKVVKPDILMIVEKGFSVKKPINTTNIEEDSVMKEIKETIMNMEQYAKRIYLLGPIPNTVPTPGMEAVKYLQQKKRLKDSPSLVVNDHFPQIRRFGEIPKFCPKCHVFEWEHIFHNEASEFQLFNSSNDILYFDDWKHLNFIGLEMMATIYQNIAHDIRKRPIV